MNKYKTAMNDVKFSENFTQRTMETMLEKTRTKKAYGKLGFVYAGVAVCVCAVALFAMPILKGNKVNTGYPENQNTNESLGLISAYVSKTDEHLSAMVLPIGAFSEEADANFAPTTNEKLTVVEFDGDKVQGIGGVDFVVSGDKLKSVSFESKNNVFLYEDTANFKTTDGKSTRYNWSEYRFFIEKDKLPDNPTKEDVISALEAIQFSNAESDKLVMRQFIDRVYSQEVYEVAEFGKSVVDFIEEKLEEPIDFSEFDIQYTIEDFADKAGEKPGFSVIIENPDNKAVKPIEGNSVTIRPGEYVTLCLNDNAKLAEMSRSEIEAYTDEITITASFENGQTKTQKWKISFDSEGCLVFSEIE